MSVKATFPLLDFAGAINNTSLSEVQVILFWGYKGVFEFGLFFFFSFA